MSRDTNLIPKIMTQLHKRLSVEQISVILDQYTAGQMKSREARLKLGLGKTRFFSLLKRYAREGKDFKATADTEHTRNKIGEKAENVSLRSSEKKRN
jgi:hypothetical protein